MMKLTTKILFATCLSLFLFGVTNAAEQPTRDVSAKDILGKPENLAFCYGGYRGTSRETVPSIDELKEDMRILSAMGVKLIRTYNTQQFAQAERLLEAIEQLRIENPKFEMYVMLGAWIDCEKAWTEDANHKGENAEGNADEVGAAVMLANRYPKSVKMIAVGNESMVHWATNYYVEPGVILKWVNHLQGLKKKGELPTGVWITSSDNFASWGGEAPAYHKPDLEKLFRAVDFVSMHTYPFHDTHYVSDFWIAPEGEAKLTLKEKADKAVDRAVQRAMEQYESVSSYMKSLGVDKPIHIGETGWASISSGLYGENGSQAADEYKAKVFYENIRDWTNKNGISCFYFEAFNERWKDAGNEWGSENHFGLINLEGHAKYPLWELVDAGAFKGLTRGGKPIVKTWGGDEAKLLAGILPVPAAGNWDGTVLTNVNADRALGTPVSENTYLVFHGTMTPENTQGATWPSEPVKLNVWEGTCELKKVESEMHVRTGTGDWWGCGVEIQSNDQGEDMSNFADGKLRFEIRGNTTSKFLAGFQTGRYAAGNQTNNGVLFGPDEKFELTEEWKSWEIPVRDLIEIDPKANLKNVTALFMMRGEKDFDGEEVKVRNVSYTSGKTDESTEKSNKIPEQSQLVPFHIPGDDSTENATSFASNVPTNAGSRGFVEIQDGKFSIGGERQRFWGVNLCFSACFPTHEEAVKIAAHFRKLGLNIVRFHHMDMQDAPGGIWRTRDDGKRELDPEQIDRLDFFLNELHKNGVYANLNLHVSRTLTKGDGFPEYQSGLWWTGSNKWIMYYDPDVQRELKKYCRDLLTHTNPYRGKRRVDDPGVALVEMLNENYFSVKGTELLRRLPQRFQDSFRVKWNCWLEKKYGSEAKMYAAWENAQQPMGDFLIEPASWKTDLALWTLGETNVTAARKFGQPGPSNDIKAVRFEPTGRSDADHHLQLRQLNHSVKAKQPYTFKVWARADKARSIKLEVATSAGGEWRDLGLFETVSIGTQWQQIRRTIFPRETIDNEVAVAINFGLDATPLELADVLLQEGAEMIALDKSQSFSASSVGVPETGWPSASHGDLQVFMVDTERAWVAELKSYLTDELGVKVPITASQENYHAPGVIAETCDFVDLHNYWHHPLFPGDAEWSRAKWTVEQQAIESAPTRSDWPANSLLMRTGWRYHDMPFTLSEWNQGEPNVTGTGGVMMGAIIGALQDWDGIMYFNYTENGGRWFADHYKGWFDFAGHPAKQAVLAAAGNIYLRGDLNSLKDRKSGTHSDRLDGRASFKFKLGVDTKATESDSVKVPETDRFETPDGSLIWDATSPEKAFLQLNTAGSVGVWGLIADQQFKIGDMEIAVGDIPHDYATILLTSKDNKPIAESKSLLLLASTSAENTGMQWNEDRNSTGENWGTGPTLIYQVNASFRIPKSSLAAKPQVYALDGTGKRTGEVTVDEAGENYKFQIGSDHATLWYEVAIE